MSKQSGLDVAVDKAIASIEDPEIEARYPNRTHFVAADNPDHPEMVSQALLAGDPVVLVYADGREILFTPEEVVEGVVAILMALAAAWMRIRPWHKKADVIQLPARTKIEARDSSGIPLAA